jgi:chromate transporter
VLPVHDHSGIVFKTYGTRPDVAAFVKGVTAAATGAMRGAGIVLGHRGVRHSPRHAHAEHVGAGVTGEKLPEPVLALGTDVIRLILYPLIGHVP